MPSRSKARMDKSLRQKFYRGRQRTVRDLLRKVTGTAALLDQTCSDPLQVFVAFSSLAGRFGGVGQTGSALANEALAAMLRAASAERFGTRFTTIH